MNTRPRFASEERARLRGLGLEGDALELALRASAPARHEWRANRAREEACDEADRLLEGALHAPQEAIDALAALLLALEVMGQAGPRGLGGPGRGTLRQPWAQCLGAGRHQAADGAAWDAAIVAAQASLAPNRLEVTPTEGGVLAGAAAALPLTHENAPWIRALAGRVVLALTQEGRWEGDAVAVAVDGEGLGALTVGVRRTDLHTWGELFGEADRLTRTPAPPPLADLRPDLGDTVPWSRAEAAFFAVASALDQVEGRTLDEVRSWLADHGAFEDPVVRLDRLRALPAVCAEAHRIVRAIAAAAAASPPSRSFSRFGPPHPEQE